MTLDETIKVYEEGVSKESEQVAEWLKELKRLKEAKVAEMWVARGRDGITSFFISKPTYNEDYDCFLPSCSWITSKTWLPEVAFENSPRKVKLILEDE
jgi:hypothetical protein